jgi:hypothetical protein
MLHLLVIHRFELKSQILDHPVGVLGLLSRRRQVTFHED